MRRRLAAALTVGTALAALLGACVGRPAGNDTPKEPGEQNPARNGPPYPN